MIPMRHRHAFGERHHHRVRPDAFHLRLAHPRQRSQGRLRGIHIGLKNIAVQMLLCHCLHLLGRNPQQRLLQPHLLDGEIR